MTGCDAYLMYCALKVHYKPGSKYDFIKSNGKTSVKRASFDKRNDKHFFNKIAKHYGDETLDFLVANLSRDPSVWVGSLGSQLASDLHTFRKKRIESLSYVAPAEVYKVSDDFNECLRPEDGHHPPLLSAYVDGSVSLETLIVVDDLTSCVSLWAKAFSSDPLVQEVAFLVSKTRSFLRYDRQRLREAFISKFS